MLKAFESLWMFAVAFFACTGAKATEPVHRPAAPWVISARPTLVLPYEGRQIQTASCVASAPGLEITISKARPPQIFVVLRGGDERGSDLDIGSLRHIVINGETYQMRSEVSKDANESDDHIVFGATYTASDSHGARLSWDRVTQLIIESESMTLQFESYPHKYAVTQDVDPSRLRRAIAHCQRLLP